MIPSFLFKRHVFLFGLVLVLLSVLIWFLSDNQNDPLRWAIFLTSLLISFFLIIIIILRHDSYQKSMALARQLDKRLEHIKVVEKTILNSIGNGLAVLDQHQNITLLNPAAELMLGLKKKDILGKSWLSVVRPKNEKGQPLEKSHSPIQKVLEKKDKMYSIGIKDRIFYTRKNGATFPIAETAASLLLKGKKLGVVIVFRDITEELETDRAKNEFVSIASHQLRTPITAINWFTETLLTSPDMSKENKGYLQSVYDSSQRAVRLINALLNVARIDTGTFSIQPQKIDLNQIVKQNLQDNQSAFAEEIKKMKIKLNLDKTIRTFRADPEILYIICDNLISNAIKYTPKEGGRVLVETFQLKKGEMCGDKKITGASVALRVSDSGYGIPKVAQKHIFSKLFRADNVKEHHQGTGLGLYVVKSIVEHGGGQIWFESKEDKGATFYVIFPKKGMSAKEGEKSLELDKRKLK